MYRQRQGQGRQRERRCPCSISKTCAMPVRGINNSEDSAEEARLSGLLRCSDCQKPRGIYSLQAIAKMRPPGDHTPQEAQDCMGIAEQALEDATNSAIFVCGMQPVFEGSPCCDIFQCDPKLTCAAPVESDFYSRQTNPLMAAGDFSRDLNMCAICAGTSHDPLGGEVDPDLKTIYSTVLPICNICKSRGAKTVVGRYGRAGKAIEERLDQRRRAEAAAAARGAARAAE